MTEDERDRLWEQIGNDRDDGAAAKAWGFLAQLPAARQG